THQKRSANRERSEQVSSFKSPQQPRTEEAPDHRAAPVEGYVTRRSLCRKPRDVGLAEVVHKKTSDRYFRAHISKNAERAEHEVGMFPDRIAALGVGAIFCM